MLRLVGVRSSCILRAKTLHLQNRNWKLHIRHTSRPYPTFNSALTLRAVFSIAASGQSLTASTQPSKPLLLSLERSIGPRAGSDQNVWDTGLFSAEVYPDLPIAASWGELCSKLLSSKSSTTAPNAAQRRQDSQKLRVTTVGCQVRSRESLKRRLYNAVGADQNGQPALAKDSADAVLIVSGSHPAHSIATSLQWSPSSFELLRMASSMRQEAQLPASLRLWAVENPLRNPASRLQQKLEAGAEVILTQPPLLWDRFESWWSDANRQGLTEQCQVVVGVPMLTSAANLSFWLHLCDASGADGAIDLVQEFKEHEADKEELARFTRTYNRSLVQKILQMPGIGGMHVMPLTKAARKQTVELLQDHVIPKMRME